MPRWILGLGSLSPDTMPYISGDTVITTTDKDTVHMYTGVMYSRSKRSLAIFQIKSIISENL